uniref:AB hydrolase-1 domain-containing protein n=1 Tax=Macrostomum lignano TaxID=282301 RepID=A0A1I8JNM7_9PLAT
MVDLYKRLLKENDVHILALDYRGYGDSEGLLETEIDAVDDAEVLFNYVTKSGVKRLYLWGHSLGRPYRLLPYFEPVFVDGVGKCGIRFAFGSESGQVEQPGARADHSRPGRSGWCP